MRSALAVAQLGDSLGAAKAIAGIGLAVATTDRVEALALLACEAEPRHGDAHADRGRAVSRDRLAPKPLVAHSARTAGCSGRDGADGMVGRQDHRGCERDNEDQMPDGKHERGYDDLDLPDLPAAANFHG